ncbi:MAG: chemotaxis protein CheW [Gammaproteobacteria bacterium HGW-Gammaproteobacteria-13]|uniref:chemotaxis protein CheW n=1 Tax=unclassified Pseudomonas TaxID=196821 RepID=UPI000CBC4097|nr:MULTISPECIES: chemotaxis protein CheW [unclassified Pseudomonas]MDF3195049.1 chemotaxis protein CheW [Pseudomonas sp. 1928-m]MDP2748978.1 chemotaxis protein CheW [Pseudomonas sp.]MDZ4337385.1 chemotaxis protein CheW [Pseudomonas sp.]PKM23414.1 MAG: chemotaxis protein CheW [Gammaproteobacteria bacterium HGW-Gammaproteobacteria-13]
MSTLPAHIQGRAAAPVETPLTQQFLTLTLGQELFALPIEHIREIIEFGGLTEIPLMPSFLRGVINLRGAVVPVIDLAVRFGRERTPIAKRTCIVIVEVEQGDSMQLLGIIVDAVNEVLAVEGHQLESRPAFGARIRADFIAGILKHHEQFVVVLDIPQVLSLDELAELVGGLEQSEV